MTTAKSRAESERERIIAEGKRAAGSRQQGYREQALKILPWVCGKCGREFTGKKVRELTVHHKDHNYENNPPDGGNWELLCLYCHDNEHERLLDAEHLSGTESTTPRRPTSTHTPFEALQNLLKGKK